MVEFAYAIGRIRALENSLIDQPRLLRLAEARNFESAYLLLREIPHYAEKIDSLENAFDFPKLLELELSETLALLRELAPGNEMLAVLEKRSAPGLALVDYLAELKSVAAKSASPLFSRYAEAFIIFQEIKLALLSQDQKVEELLASFHHTPWSGALNRGVEEYKSSGSLAGLERELDNTLLELLHPAKYQAFGIEPLIGFLIAKEQEIKNLRLILTAKQLQLPAKLIKERIRHAYV